MEPGISSKNSKKNPKTCLVCGKGFSLKDGLKQYVQYAHDRQKPHRCTICNYSFYNKGKLKIHVVSVHEYQKPYKCTFVITASHKKVP